MARAVSPGGPGLPWSAEQALTLFQHLFQRQAGLDQLQAAMRQVQEEVRACVSGLELPSVLLAMERRCRAQEQLLWDLELLTGAGLGLFWPPQVQFCGLRLPAWWSWSQYGESRGSDSGLLRSWSPKICPSPQAGESLSLNRQPPKGRRAQGSVSAPDLREARTGWKWKNRTPEPTVGCLQGLTASSSSSSFEETGSLKFKRVPRRSALPEPRDPPAVLGWRLLQDRAELAKLLGLATAPRQRASAPREQQGASPEGESREAPPSPAGDDPKCQEPPPCPSPAQLPGDGGSPGIPVAFPPGEQVPLPGGTGSPDPAERNDSDRPSRPPAEGGLRAAQEGICAPQSPGVPAPALLSPRSPVVPSEQPEAGADPGPAGRGAGGARELRAGGPERPVGGRRGGAGVPQAWTAAWRGPPGGEAALQRLLELQGAARRRRRQQREQQRLRVLDRLRVARNRHCRVHPLGPAPALARLPPQEDPAGQRRALREQLEQVHRQRAGWLRALGARNTQDFQQLLWPPGSKEPAPGDSR